MNRKLCDKINEQLERCIGILSRVRPDAESEIEAALAELKAAEGAVEMPRAAQLSEHIRNCVTSIATREEMHSTFCDEMRAAIRACGKARRKR